MLKRKIEEELIAWKANPNRKPIVIKGCRQCGKTFIVQKFAEENYANVVYLNFMQDPDYALAFEGSKRVDDIVMNLSAIIPQSKFVPGETCIIIDEIQECPAARTALKFFKMDGRYDIIATGSLLGVKGYGERQDRRGSESTKTSIPVGYETIIEMHPLDFEEFLWANGISDAIISKLAECLDNKMPVPEAIHQKMRQLILQYTVVGGMPFVVNIFVNTHIIWAVYLSSNEAL
ncbi:ATP-binding protein [Prevotella sp.]|mgnify:FL=1|uniref:ATP-binding protein n=1 Tax=Prevotella sp. TaxID=59823 RepID=UPI00307BF24D